MITHYGKYTTVCNYDTTKFKDHSLNPCRDGHEHLNVALTTATHENGTSENRMHDTVTGTTRTITTLASAASPDYSGTPSYATSDSEYDDELYEGVYDFIVARGRATYEDLQDKFGESPALAREVMKWLDSGVVVQDNGHLRICC